MATDAFKTLTGAPRYDLTRNPAYDRLVPKYDQAPDDAFELPCGICASQPLTDAQSAQRLRNCAEELEFYVKECKTAGLGVDIAWDDDAGKLFITIVREF